MSRSLSRSLKATIIISLTLLVLQGLLSFSMIGNFRAAIRENVDKQQYALVQTLARETDQKILGHLRLLAHFAANLPEQALSDPGAAQSFLARHEESAVTFDHGFFLFGPHGEVITDHPLDAATERRVSRTYREVVEAVKGRRAPQVSAPLPSPFDGEPVVIFCAPVITADGKVRSVIGGAISLLHGNFLSNIAKARVGTSGYLYLFSTDRTMIVHPDKSRILQRDVPPGKNLFFDSAIKGFDGSGETVNSRGVPCVSSCQHLSTVPWILASNFPIDEAYAPLRRARYNLFLAIALTLAGSSVALLLIGVRMKREVRQRARAEAHAALLLKSVGEGIIGVSPTGTIDYANGAAAANLGYDSPQDLMGRDVRQILHHSPGACPDCQHESCLVTPVLSEGSERRCENETLLRKDGTTLRADFSCTPVAEGDVIRGAVVVFRDVTRRREAEERLRLLGAALEAAANSILIADAQSRILWVNDAFTRSTGYSNSEAVGSDPIELLSAGADPAILAQLMETLARQEAWHGELETRRRDGTVYPEEVTITPVQNEQGAVTNFIGIMQDITERREAEQEVLAGKRALEEANRKLVQAMNRAGELAERAERANAAKSRFLANMSHEIRTPLHAIIGMNHLLLDTPLTQRQHEYLRTVGRSAESLLGIVNDILDFSKIEAGKLEIEKVRFSPEEVVREVLAPFQAQATEKALELRLELDPQLPRLLEGDPLRLSQILNNVLGNALKFTATGSVSLQVRNLAKCEDQWEFLFRVDDTGPGIAEEDRTRLFQPFQQLDGSVTRTYGGTGLGLAISRQLATLMGGSIWCESAPGAGSTFYIRLPFTMVQGNESARSPGDDLLSIAGTRVLVAEDNEINQMVARELLKKAGAEVVVAENGQVAVDLVREQEFDVVLMDVQMPVMDGLTATRAIRALPKPGIDSLPIFAMTADAMEHEVRECQRAGMTGHLPKPFPPQRLYAAISHAVAGRSPSGNPSVPPLPPEPSPEPETVPTLDREKAVRQLAGNSTLYGELARRFLLDYRDSGEKMRALLASGAHADALTLAHSVKGVAGVLAAERLRRAAEALEAALKRGERGCDPWRFIGEIEETVRAAEGVAAESAAVTVKAAGSELLQRCDLAGIEAALRRCDPKECAEELRQLSVRPWREDAAQLICRLERLINDYRYDEALLFLEALPGE